MRRRWREAARPRGTRTAKHVPDSVPGKAWQAGWNRVRLVARRDKDIRFTALLHHVDLSRLRAAFAATNPKATPGVDKVTWETYGQDLRTNLENLLSRVHSGAYRASPSRRVYIPKPDGRLRPLGIATLEDKIVQRAVVEVLNAIYEEDFLGFSYGFRPGRSPHDALDALSVGISRKKVNYVLDADISDFFSKLDHSWLEKFLGHRIADKRVLRLIRKWLNAGVIEDGNWKETIEGSPQGASVSPLLANVYLHYVFDQWARQWRNRHARGDMVVVRFADDFVAGFQHLGDAKQFLKDLRERFAKFNLELHPEKTRLIEFGRFAARHRSERGLPKPETFDFLGFTHICGKTRDGRFWLRRITIQSRMRAKLKRVKTELKRRRHLVASSTGGCRLSASCIPNPACASTPGPEAGARCGSSARRDLSGGPPARAVPTGMGGLPGLLLRVPAGPRPAPGTRCPGGRGHEEESELGAGRGHPRLLRPARSGLADEVPPAPDRG